MALRFQRCLGPVTSLEAQQFTIATASGEPAIACPLCGGTFDLPETHSYDREGVVVPALECPDETCPFSDYIVLGSISEDVLA